MLRAGCLGLSAPSSLSPIGSAYSTTPQSALTGKPSDCTVGGVSQTSGNQQLSTIIYRSAFSTEGEQERMPIPAHWLLSPKRNPHPGQVLASIPTLPMSRHSFRVAAAFSPTLFCREEPVSSTRTQAGGGNPQSGFTGFREEEPATESEACSLVQRCLWWPWWPVLQL